VVGVPQQAGSYFHEGMTPAGGLHADDSSGPVADRVGEPARRGVRSQVVNGLLSGARRPLQPAAHEMPTRSITRRGNREVVNNAHQPVTGDGERVARQEAGIPEGGNGRQTVEDECEQGALPDVFRHAVLVMSDDGPLPPPRQVAAPDAASDRTEVTTEVQQHQIVERYRCSFGERGQLGPDLREAPRADPAYGVEPTATRRTGDVLAQPGQQRPTAHDVGYLVAHMLAQRPEHLAVRTAHGNPAQLSQPVLVKRDIHTEDSRVQCAGSRTTYARSLCASTRP
jgi:hypothetical protein